MTAVDGKITGSFMETYAATIVGEEYERTNDFYHPDAWLCGRVTTEENFTNYHKSDVNENAPQVFEGDYITVKDAPMYYVSADASGKVGWTTNTIVVITLKPHQPIWQQQIIPRTRFSPVENATAPIISQAKPTFTSW